VKKMTYHSRTRHHASCKQLRTKYFDEITGRMKFTKAPIVRAADQLRDGALGLADVAGTMP
jgi:hypothetical protein